MYKGQLACKVWHWCERRPEYPEKTRRKKCDSIHIDLKIQTAIKWVKKTITGSDTLFVQLLKII